eukprot:819695-Rhodomonas_salina.1
MSNTKQQKRKFELVVDLLLKELEDKVPRERTRNFGAELEPLYRQYNGCLKALKKGLVPAEDLDDYKREVVWVGGQTSWELNCNSGGYPRSIFEFLTKASELPEQH